MEDKIIFREEAYAIQGAIFEVYREMGNGFLEAVYQECLERELNYRRIPYISQEILALSYKGELLKQKFFPDLICYNKIIVELKATNQTSPLHEAQMLNYLKATKMKLGLLVNFGTYPKVNIKRFAL